MNLKPGKESGEVVGPASRSSSAWTAATRCASQPCELSVGCPMADIEQRARDLQRVRAAHPNNPAGSLATAKPPRDLRTKVRPVTEEQHA